MLDQEAEFLARLFQGNANFALVPEAPLDQDQQIEREPGGRVTMTLEKPTVWGIGGTRAMRVHWTLLELGVDYDTHAIRTRSPGTQTEEFAQLNPKRKIPVLCHGPLVLTESAAIVSYLTDTFPAPQGFFVPSNAAQRARLNEWSYFVMTELDAHSLYLIRRHEGLKEVYGEAPEAVASAREYFLKQVNAMAEKVDAAGKYLMGEDFSTADIIFMSCLDWAMMYEFPLPKALVRYHERVTKRPIYQKAMRLNYPELYTDGT
jgi:glutathione S-transferase